MEFKKRTLDNGLVVIGEINKSAKSAAVGFFVKTGARDETMDINGVSHFLEHMMFKGTEKLSSFDVNEAFDHTGAQFNAFTSEENTVYYAAILPEYMADITGLWIELMRPALRDDDFNIEKNVIKEEIAMYKDMPSFDVMERCRTLYFDGHPCGNSVLGSDESIDGLKSQQMREYFSRRYAPNNIVAALVGNFDWNGISAVIADRCGQWPTQQVGRKLDDYKGAVRQSRVEKANLSMEHICLMSPCVPAQDNRRFAASLLSIIVGDDSGSRFFWELVDKALAETATMQYGGMDGTGAMQSYISCSTKNAAKVMDIVKDILARLYEKGVTEDEVRKAKNKVLSALVLKNEVPMGRLLDVGFNWQYLEQYRSVEEDVAAIKAVTVEEIESLIKQYNPGSFTQLSLGPA